jgi:hypothetical protein
MDPPSHEVTQLLVAWGNGDQAARDELMSVVYHELLHTSLLRPEIAFLTISCGDEIQSQGPKRWRYSVELRNAFTISALMKLPLN